MNAMRGKLMMPQCPSILAVSGFIPSFIRMNSQSYLKCSSALAALCLGAASPSASAALTVAPGDLLMGFFKVNAAGTGVEANTYVYNLGAASLFREGTYVSMNIDNIGTDLASAFGGGWALDTTIRWGIVGVVGPTDPLTNGDPARTVYYSKDWNGTPRGSTGVTFSSTQMGSMATFISTFSAAMNGVSEGGAIDGGAIVGSATPSSFSSFVPPTAGTSFGVSLNPLNALGSATEGLDVYRALFSTTAPGVDLTAALSPGDAALRAQQYIGTFTLSSTGDLRITPIPEPASALLCSLGLGALVRRRRS
jgi:hypothetical protein